MNAGAIEDLLALMERLRDAEAGCPWDKAQSFATIAPYTIEEAYEVADAIERDDMAALKEELGDLLFQVVFHARMAEEAKAFDFAAVVREIVEKMTRRHPHIFGDAELRGVEAQREAWETQKAAERAAKAVDAPARTLGGIPSALPALVRAAKIQSRLARAGFVWPDLAGVLGDLSEELRELEAELVQGADKDRIEDELGDVLFVCANLGRFLDIDPEAALRRANAKVERRFGAVEDLLAQEGRTPKDASLAEMDALWDVVKAAEKG